MPCGHGKLGQKSAADGKTSSGDVNTSFLHAILLQIRAHRLSMAPQHPRLACEAAAATSAMMAAETAVTTAAAAPFYGLPKSMAQPAIFLAACNFICSGNRMPHWSHRHARSLLHGAAGLGMRLSLRHARCTHQFATVKRHRCGMLALCAAFCRPPPRLEHPHLFRQPGTSHRGRSRGWRFHTSRARPYEATQLRVRAWLARCAPSEERRGQGLCGYGSLPCCFEFRVFFLEDVITSWQDGKHLPALDP